VYFETASNLIIPNGALGDEKDIAGLYIYTVEVVQGRTLSNDAIGVSSGAVNQVFKLSYAEALPNTMVLSVFNGTTYEVWERVESFIDSKADSNHYRIIQNEEYSTFIIFGDGFTGKIPPTGANPIYVTYRIGGGEKGNVAPNTLTLLNSNTGFVNGTFNPYTPIEKGTDREDKDSIKRNAPAYNRTRWGLLKEEDFVDHIRMNYSDTIKTSSAVSDLTNPNLLKIRVLPKPPHTLESITPVLLADLLDRRIVGSEFTILPTQYKTTDITFSLIVLDHYDQNTVKNTVSFYALSLLQDLEFGEEVILSSLCSDIQSTVEGIKSLRVVDPVDDIILPTPEEIVQINSVIVNAIGGDL
jgi:hypothetical protein